MQYHAMSVLQETERVVRVFGLLPSLDGIRPELISAHTEERLSFVPILAACVLAHHGVTCQDPACAKADG